MSMAARGSLRALAGALLWLAGPMFGPSALADAVRTFVGCPVYRDTNSGRKSGCWLAVDPSSGIRYDISLGRTKPQIGREVLVEGRLQSAEASGLSPAEHSPCGGVVLAPVIVSVLPSLCPDFLLPAEGFPGRRFVLDPRVVLAPADVVEKLPSPPFRPRTWSIEFTYGSDFLQYQYSEVILDEIGRYVRASHPRRIEIIGYAMTRPRTISGRKMAEKFVIAKERAETVALALSRLGARPEIMRVTWRNDPAPLRREAGLAAASQRRVDVRLSY
jgi:hypothetical protein